MAASLTCFQVISSPSSFKAIVQNAVVAKKGKSAKEVGIKSSSGVQGDQLVNIKIAIPKNLTEEQIKHIQYLKDTGI